MIKTMAGMIAALALVAAPWAAGADHHEAADLELWRLDCGKLEISDLGAFSDAYLYDGQQKTLTDSCYLIRNGDRYLLWDTGLPAALKGTAMTQGIFTVSIERTLVEQLADLDLTAADIDFVGLSHHHFDHVAQAPDFGESTLLLNRRDVDLLREGGNAETAALLAPWLEQEGSLTAFSGDHDVFGDGSVTILAMPGHTPGHSALLVRLAETGPVLLAGDLYHFDEQIENEGVPTFNSDRADTLASFARFWQAAKALDAKVILQHEPDDIGELPPFPASAR